MSEPEPLFHGVGVAQPKGSRYLFLDRKYLALMYGFDESYLDRIGPAWRTRGSVLTGEAVYRRMRNTRRSDRRTALRAERRASGRRR